LVVIMYARNAATAPPKTPFPTFRESITQEFLQRFC